MMTHLPTVRIRSRLPGGSGGNPLPVDSQRASELQALLEGVDLPAKKRDLIAYARRQDEGAVQELQRLPDREYRTIDEVGDELLAVRPLRSQAGAFPHEESDKPPGG